MSRTSSLNIFKDYDRGLGKGFGSRLDISTIGYPPTSTPVSLLACLRSHELAQNDKIVCTCVFVFVMCQESGLSGSAPYKVNA